MLGIPGESAQEPVTGLRGVGPARSRQLLRLGIETISDLLLHLPLRYEDWRPPQDPERLALPETFALCGTVTRLTHRGRGRVPRTAIELDCGGISARTVLFGRRWLPGKIKRGSVVSIYGEWEMKGDVLECAGEQISLSARADVRPIYPTTEGLSSGMLEKLVRRALDRLGDSIPRVPPPSALGRHELFHLPRALRTVHRPITPREAERARLSLAFLDFLLFHIALRTAGRVRRRESGTAHGADPHLSSSFLDGLPFDLTGAQQRAIREIDEDMASARRMHRLLQGDVSSGKTVVATWASLRAVENHGRALWLVPTRLLAEQHVATLSEQVETLGVKVAPLVGGQQESVPDARVIVGTHALLSWQIDDVSLLVIDEQQRFGVRQRAMLQRSHPRSDVLLMSATPIPRTLAGVLMGGVSVSTIDQLPGGRGEVTTQIVDGSERAQLLNHLRRCVREEGGVYVVCPSIDDDGDDVASVISVTRRLCEALPGISVASVHGRMCPHERAERLTGFRDGNIDVLVGTTVLEVGLDISRARMMVVENAERFGLAELHQLRGRIGRGEAQGICYLIPGQCAEGDALDRLRMLEQTHDGAKIARADMNIRGMGDFFSSFQHGMPQLMFPEYLTSSRFQRAVTGAARRLLSDDPQLANHEQVREMLIHLYSDSLPVATVL